MAKTRRPKNTENDQPADPNCESDAHEYQRRIPYARRPSIDIDMPGSGIGPYTYLGDLDGF